MIKISEHTIRLLTENNENIEEKAIIFIHWYNKQYRASLTLQELLEINRDSLESGIFAVQAHHQFTVLTEEQFKNVLVEVEEQEYHVRKDDDGSYQVIETNEWYYPVESNAKTFYVMEM